MDQALEELIGFQVGSRVLTGREVKPHAPNRRPPLLHTLPSTLRDTRLARDGDLRQTGAAAGLPVRCWGLTPRQNSLCLALPPFSSSLWPGSQVALTFLGLASRPESVCVCLRWGLFQGLVWCPT